MCKYWNEYPYSVRTPEGRLPRTTASHALVASKDSVSVCSPTAQGWNPTLALLLFLKIRSSPILKLLSPKMPSNPPAQPYEAQQNISPVVFLIMSSHHCTSETLCITCAHLSCLPADAEAVKAPCENQSLQT